MFFLCLFAALDCTPALDDVCIVTGADHNYFDLLKDLIASIRKQPSYKRIAIFVCDFGLTSEERDILVREYGVAGIKDPGFDMAVPSGTPSYVKNATCRAFLDKHFPGFKYYMWIDSDIWINKEFVLNRFINLAKKQGFSMAQENFSNFFCLKKYGIIPWVNFGSIMFKKTLNVGMFCSNERYLHEWADYCNHVMSKGCRVRFFIDQNTANYIYYRNKLEPLKACENYACLEFGYPVLHNGELKEPRTLQPIGAIHLACNKTVRDLGCKIPIRIVDKPLGLLPYIKHLWLSYKWHKEKAPTFKEGHKMMTMRFSG